MTKCGDGFEEGPAISELERIVREKLQRQSGTSTFFDKTLTSLIQSARELSSKSSISGSEAARRLHTIRSVLATAYAERSDPQKRFVSYQSRREECATRAPQPWDLSPWQMRPLQGMYHCMQWRDLAIFKTVFEFALYPMILWDLKPATIIEIGAGTGGSALWLADISGSLGIEVRVVSFDKQKPELQDRRVTFIEGDCDSIAVDLPKSTLSKLPHPWLAIEDAHANIAGVLSHILEQSRVGDYLIVEDSSAKISELDALTRDRGSSLAVDTYYTDFFGRNATCCPDSIFIVT